MNSEATLTLPGTLSGARRISPIAVLVVPFGAAYGVAAIEAGISQHHTLLMSATVFAAASQFVSMDFWTSPLSLLPLLIAVFAVNARHILLGATLYPWLRHLPAGQRHLIATLISDTNWAVAIQAHRNGENDVGILLGSGLALWVAWMAGVAIGVFLGTLIGDPELYGLDLILFAFFAAVLADIWKGRESLVPWIVSAIVAVVAMNTLPENWHIVTGALAGGIVGAVRNDN